MNLKLIFICFILQFSLITISEGGTKLDKKDLDGNIHHFLGIDLNMQVWNLLGKTDRDQNDNNRMVAFAKGSLYHWQYSPHFKPVNAQRGEWLISRVYAVLNVADKALEHAQKCKAITEEQNLQDFDLAYSYEALARAYALSGDRENFKKYYQLAKETGKKITEEENRQVFLDDLKSEPWNGFLENTE